MTCVGDVYATPQHEGRFLAFVRNQPQTKDAIVLHHTVGGSAQSTFDYWRTDPQHIGTAYIIDRDGTIHCSIGVEIASEGALLERGGKYYAFGRMAEATRFVGPVFDCGKTWRDYRYFAQYTAAAMDSVCALVDHLLAIYSIPRQTPADHSDFDFPGLRNFSGVMTHCQLRADKTDCHPGFDWDRLAKQCNLETGALAVKAR